MSTPCSDAERLLQAAQAGIKDALGQLLVAHRDYLLLIANQELKPSMRRIVGASDLVQQTIAEAHEDFADFQGGEKELLAWLRRLLINNLLNLERHYGAKKRDRKRTRPLEGGSSAPQPEPIGKEETPSVKVMRKEQEEAAAKALKRLPDHYRQVIELHCGEELTFEEISRVMCRSANAVEQLYRRAKARLQKEMAQAS